MEIGKPMPLASNKGKSFQGSIVLGKGFVLTSKEALDLIEKDPRNKEVLFPYLNGEDLNNDPNQEPSRWVINFFDWSEEKARTYPDCFDIVERSVKPERLIQKDKGGKEKWWQFLRPRKELYNAISELDQVMVINNHTRHHVFAFYSKNIVYSHALTVITIDSLSYYSIMTSQIMNEWAWHKGSTMGTSTLRYTSSQIFETFPFPPNISESENNFLKKLGEEYLAIQRNIMKSMNLGLTKIYNFFHNKDLRVDENTSVDNYNDILRLRNLQVKLDIAVLNLFGWSDINPNHNFYDIEYLPENDRTRFSIHPEARKEILKRLLSLNHQRYNEEVSENSKNIKTKHKKTGNQKKEANFPKLF
ncbi:hypothetical protein SAMN05421866_0786 [Chryseobacterium oranimense]|uniref:MmeI-like target recognition domain-containing protein n=1 Tax=Chryseobacterium oranimense TaxID=421058 RepID=A0A1M5KPI3_9FLAO|nr:type IIL restriction-modification enzyme MmeI [Chryseobacterium oranimense]SHG54668.1 hypothetical protein SAMN05421866_0786 [Chryseobacterium oranimense]